MSMEIINRNDQIVIISDKKEIVFESTSVAVDSLVIDFPGEYEKSGFLVTHHEIQGKPLFTLRIEGKNIAYIPTDSLEITEAVVDFFGNIDILVIPGDKAATKIFENLETRMVLPYGSEKSLFLSSLGQNIEPIEKYKSKESDFESDTAVFLNIV